MKNFMDTAKIKVFFILALILVLVLPTGTTGQIETGADATAGPQPDRIVKTGSEICYGISKEFGFLASKDSGRTWELKNTGLPEKLVYPFLTPKIRQLTALGVDPKRPERVAVTTTTRLFLSEDGGGLWEQIEISKYFTGGYYLTAVALSPDNPEAILVGTSFAGIFESKNRGKTWENISKNLNFLYQGLGFWEEIPGLAYDPANPGRIIFASGFGGGIYELARDRKSATKIQLESEGDPAFEQEINQLHCRPAPATGELAAKEDWLLEIGTREAVWLYSFSAKQLTKEVDRQLVEIDPSKQERLAKASGKHALYFRWDSARGKQLDKWLDFLKKNGFNAIVVDCKDDNGYITYNTKLTMPREVKAVIENGIVIEELLEKAREKEIYVIGRVVVFQDPRLFRYQNNKYAVWDKYVDRPWSTREYWVDTFCPEVWEYNLEIAQELQELGIDEIQFDYIRFATDGDTYRIKFRYRPEGAEKMDALESFLSIARERIQVPISTDLYGFNCWCRVDNYNGQNMDLFSNYVDIVCPMFYPSHFPAGFLKSNDYLERAKRLYYDGSRRAQSIAGGRSIIRPYVQSFLLGGELRMKEPSYTKYLLNQIDGTLSSPAAGFTLWDYSNRYYMVTKPVADYLGKIHRESENIPGIISEQ